MSSVSIKIKSTTSSGNLVSKSERKVRRKFETNRQTYSLFSVTLRKKVLVRGPASILRKVLFYGSFDRYLIHCKRISEEFISIRKELIKKQSEAKIEKQK